MTTNATTIQTYSHIAKPRDRRCSWLQLVLTPEMVLDASPADVDGAGTLPGLRQRRYADTELPVWSVVLDIEARHHTKNRGWDHYVGIVRPTEDGLVLTWVGEPTAAMKALIKASGAAHLLGGSGPNAAMVRCARWVLEGVDDVERERRLLALLAAK